MAKIYTPCTICLQHCSLAVTTEKGRVIAIEPDKDTDNWQDFCVKGAKSHLILDHPKRLTSILKRVDGGYIKVEYKQAVAEIAAQLNKIIDRYGADAVASYTGNPAAINFGGMLFQSLLMDAIGSANKYFVGSIDQNPHHLVYELMYGNAWASLQPDIDHCHYLVLIGSNPAVSAMNWIFHASNGWKRVLSAQSKGMQLVVVDPSFTETAAKANCHIAPLPETDWALLLGMIKVIFANNWQAASLDKIVVGLEEVRQVTQTVSLEDLSYRCDIPIDKIEMLARDFAHADSAVALAHTGPAQGKNGTLAVWLAQLLNVMTGNLGCKGGMYHSRGVLELLKNGPVLFPVNDKPSRVRGLQSIAGYRALAELPDEITTPGNGEIRALFINGGNPVISGPDGKALADAVKGLDLCIGIDFFQRESHQHADWLIPAVHFLEREELIVFGYEYGSEPHIQTLRKAVEKPEGVRYEWEFLRDLTLAMNKPLLGKPWLNWYVKLTRLYAKITNNPYNGFNPNSIAQLLIKKSGIVKVQDIKAAEHGISLQDPIDFNYFLANLPTKNGKVEVCPEQLKSALVEALSTPKRRLDIEEFPLQMISKRRKQMMNSWLTETSMVKMKNKEGDIIELNETDCVALGVVEGQTVWVRSQANQISAKVKMSNKIRAGVALMQYGWGSRTFSPLANEELVLAEGVNRNLLVSNKDLDLLSAVPRLNGTPIAVIVKN